MLIGFTGAGGRTDASHVAILAARALANHVDTTLVVDEASLGPFQGADGSFDLARLPNGRRGRADGLRRVRAACRRGGRIAIADLPADWLGRNGVGSALDMTIVVVGPHEAEEYQAAVWTERQARSSPGSRSWYLGCRRAGGGPAASGFAAAMEKLDPGARTLPFVVPPLGRSESAALMRAEPTGRALRAGLLLAAALRQAAAAASPDGFRSRLPELSDEALRIAVSVDGRSLPEKLRDLADDTEATEAGLGPTAADLADAPVLDGWDHAVVATPIFRGRVIGHPNIPEGQRIRTSEVFLTDRATWARTLSRWYVLRTPAGSTEASLQ